MRIIPRHEWGATVPTFVPMRGFPLSKLFVHHSVTGVTSDPVRDVKAIERVGQERFGRFSYNYVIHPNGNIYEGAGLTIGAHTAGHNSTAISYCFIGNYEERQMTAAQQDSASWLYHHHRASGVLAGDTVIRPHRAVRQTACPGNSVFAWLPNFPAPANIGNTSIQQEDDVAVIAWAGPHAYHKSGVHAVHILGEALAQLREFGLKEERWPSEQAFFDAHLVSGGDYGPDPSPNKAAM